jgi:cleavage and polyadenylation specificity factor subunit 1
MTKLILGEEVSHICYFEPKGLYAIATTKKIDFKLPEDDHHKDWVIERKCDEYVLPSLMFVETTLLPSTNQGSLKLLHPKAWSIIDA